MKIVTLSSKNQITLPQAMTSLLGLKPKHKIIIKYVNDEIVIKPLKTSIVQRTAGSLTTFVDPSRLGHDFDTIMKITKKKVAHHLALEE